jgi:hypothetical protein
MTGRHLRSRKWGLAGRGSSMAERNPEKF